MYPKSPLFQKAIACLQSLPNLKIEADFLAEPYFVSPISAILHVLDIEESRKLAALLK